MKIEVLKISDAGIENQARWIAESPTGIESAQAVIYTMIGGGLLGSFAVENPRQFYIDDRVAPLPYPKRAIIQAVKVLARAAEIKGLDQLPRLNIPNLGVF